MTPLAFIAPATARNLVLIVAGIGYLAYHVLRWLRQREKEEEVKRESEEVRRGEKVKGEEQGKVKSEGQGQQRNISSSTSQALTTPQPLQTSQAPRPSSLPGEELYRRARAMKHQAIPNYRVDGLYLDTIGDAAAQGYAPAMAKLGEYAMRRGTWIEAYYWMSLAKQHGMQNLDAVLRDIRRKWMMAGSPDEAVNATPVFSEEAGSIGRALLHVASGLDAANARRFLKAHHPEFLDGER